MARKRMLSPEFFISGPVNRLSIPAMVTFAGLWCYVDDYGRGEDDTALIRAAIWPRRRSQSEAKVAADLDAIAAEGLVCRYIASKGTAKLSSETVTERSRYQPVTTLLRVIHLPTWNEHQKISHKTDSKLPPCPEHEPQAYTAYLREHAQIPESSRNGAGTEPESLAMRSGRPPPRAGARVRGK